MSHKAPATDAAIGAMKIHAARAALRELHDAYCDIDSSSVVAYGMSVSEYKKKSREIFLKILSNSEL